MWSGYRTALADNEQWLADNYDKTLHGPNRRPPADIALADEDDLMLREARRGMIAGFLHKQNDQ